MTRCKKCLIPSTRPDTEFVDGVCSACWNYGNRPNIDWNQRREELYELLKRGKNGSGYDCIVPSSGGKDSHYQALTIIGMGFRPLVVTASTCHLTPIGRANINNLARYATTIEYTSDRTVRAKLNRLGLELVGDISWPEHASIFSVPFRMSVALGIPLVFYGESPQAEYGGPPGTAENRQMTRRWVSEFGGFLGLRPMDMVGNDGLSESDMQDYMLPPDDDMKRVGTEAHFLGQYIPWDSLRNAEVARHSGMRCILPSIANLWECENLDNAQTGIHDHMMYRKYGYGRLCAQISVYIRRGLIDRHAAEQVVLEYDGTFPEVYADVPLDSVLHNISMSREHLMELLDRFTNWDLFSGTERNRPILNKTAC